MEGMSVGRLACKARQLEHFVKSDSLPETEPVTKSIRLKYYNLIISTSSCIFGLLLQYLRWASDKFTTRPEGFSGIFAAMDPLTALALAGYITQFIDFADRILPKDISQAESGSVLSPSIDYMSVSSVIEQLQALVQRLPQSNHPSQNASEELGLALQDMSFRCQTIAKEILEYLVKIKRSKRDRAGRSLSSSSSLRGKPRRTLLSKRELGSIYERLSTLRNELSLHILTEIQ